MEDTQITSQDLPAVPNDVTLADASVRGSESNDAQENQPPLQNGQTSPTLLPDVPMIDVHPPLDPETNPSSATTGADTGSNVVEKESEGDGAFARAHALIQNQPDIGSPLSQMKYSIPRAKYDSMSKSKSVWTDVEMGADEAGTPEERAAFMKDVETFHREHSLDFKPPKFYGEPLNCLKLWRLVIKLGGYDVVTTSKLWRQVGESFHPPKTCTTVSWTFRIFYEKALLEYEKHKIQTGELQLPASPPCQATSAGKEGSGYQQASGSGRVRRDSAARAMQGWHTQRSLGHGEVTEPISKDKNLHSAPRREKPLKSIGWHKPKTVEHSDKPVYGDANKEADIEVVDVGPPADWVKIHVREDKDCFEVYALVPGLLREEVRVQSDPAGRLVITGQPEQIDNPWGITPFKKVVSLPSRIDPLHTSAVVSLHGRLYVRVPFEQG